MRHTAPTRTSQLLGAALLLFCSHVFADPVNVAVAANFTAPMKEIATAFEKATGHTAILSFGSTGKLYTQIIHGAPYAIFLAADQDRPQRLFNEGQASQPFTYAIGKLALWSAQSGYVDDQGKVLGEQRYTRLAIANPKTAPYGAAAKEVLDRLGLTKSVTPRLVLGDSIAQTHQFVASGNAELGFVALAQVVLNPAGSRWLVPESLYSPLKQDAVLLHSAANSTAAHALLDFLKGPEAQTIIERFGYGTQ